MVINFSPLGLTEKEVGYIGFLSTAVYCCIAPFVTVAVDKFKKHFKKTLVILSVLSTLCFIWLCFICNGLIPFSKVQIYLSSILGSGFLGISSILYFEYTVELAYPVPEGVTGGYINCFEDIFGIIFFSIFFIKNISFTWINYALVFASGIAVPLTLLTRESYNRLDIDLLDNESAEVPYEILDNSDEDLTIKTISNVVLSLSNNEQDYHTH